MAKDTVQDTFKAQSSRMICSISNKMMLATRHCPAPHLSLLSTAYGANLAKLLSAPKLLGTPITYSQQGQFSQPG